MYKIISFCFFLIFSTFCFAQQDNGIRINEIMQSNVDCLLLEHDYPDSWIELYNANSSSVDIKGYTLKNDKGESYTFPSNTTISAGGYLVIPCDKLSRGIHTSFRLESTENGGIYLLNSNGVQIDELQYQAMIAPNIAYGRTEESGQESTWGWEMVATPKSKNQPNFSTQILPNPLFSISGHVMTDPENVSIKMPDVDLPADTKIYATIDGSEPTTNAPYKGVELNFHISQNTNIRAKLISSEALSPLSVCHSFVFHPRETNIPIISITGDDYDFYSKSEGFLWFVAPGQNNSNNNFQKTWRRPMNAEFLGVVNESEQFNQNGEIAIGGHASRYYTGQPTLKLYANKRFGKKRFKANFWTNDKPSITKVKSFMVRNGGNAQTMGRVNDAALQRIFGQRVPNLDYQAYSPVIVYINGIYNGIYGIRERSQEDFVEANYNGLEDIEITDDQAYTNANIRNSTSFKNVYTLYKSSTSKYSDFEALIDVDNFMKTMIVEMFASNTDWPHNNVVMWKDKENGGKWRWILKDLDFFAIANRPSFNMFKYLLGTVQNGKAPQPGEKEYEELGLISSNARQSFLLYQKMMNFEPFREKFIDLFSVYLGDFLKPDLTCSWATSMREEIETELKETATVFDWNYNVSCTEGLPNLLLVFQRRPMHTYNQMAEFFELGSVIKMTVSSNDSRLKINDVDLTEDDFDGAYFSDRKLRLSAGKDDAKWLMKTYNNGVQEEEFWFYQSDIDLVLKDYSSCDSVSFSVEVGKSDFDEKLEELALSSNMCNNLSSVTSINIAEPQYAYANITGTNKVPSSKYDNIHAYIDFYDNAGNYMRKKILLNLQGNSSAEKKSLSIQFCEDEWIGEETPSIIFGDWVPQDEFHLKAFYEDGLRGTAEIAYQFYSQITDRNNCYPKAFPISVYLDGNFYGVMAWQLKKHRDNMGLDKKSDTHVWLDGTLNNKQLFKETISWEKFEVRNPKDLYCVDGSFYDGDNPKELMGADSPTYDAAKSKMVRSANVKQHIIELSQYWKELNDLQEGGASYSEMRSEIMKRFDVPELINYKIFSLVTNNYDGFSKNWQWFTLDGKQWTVAPYDCNLTFGYNEDGTTLWEASQSSKKYDYEMLNCDSVGPMLWIKKYFWSDVKIRYAELRNSGIINAASITAIAQKWYQRIGSKNYSEEWNRWPASPCVVKYKDNPDRFKKWISDRIALEDIYLGYTPDIMSYDLTITSAGWTTICLPFSYQLPDEIVAYSAIGIADDGSTLVLEPANIAEAFKPYILNGPAGQYHLVGESVATSVDESNYLKNGILIGTLVDCYAPVGSYVLQNNSVHGVGFYSVNSEHYIAVPSFRAYLSCSEISKLGHYRLVNNTTNINNIETEGNMPSMIYNYWGQQINANTGGFTVRRMPDGSFQKVLIK